MHPSRLRFFFATIVTTVIVGCSGPPAPPDSRDPEAELQALIDSVVADDAAIHGAVLAVIAPSRGLDWQSAAGLADPATGVAMTPDTPVRIASNTKTFVAASVLRLAEEGRLDLDDAIAAHLPAEILALLESDGYDTEAMTIRHLLTHTSGLFDHSATGSFSEEIVANPQRHWTPTDLVAMAVDLGDPHGPPGTIYTYCDTGYILLGLILEEATGLPLAGAVRELVDYDTLGLGSTWWETMEPQPDGVADRAHQFYGNIDTYGFDPAFDLYGGGGIVATMGDLARFFNGVFEGRVYHDPTTVETMLTTFDGLSPLPDAGERALPPGAYRMGVWVLQTEGTTTYHHTGFWGTMAVHVPELDLTLAATVNQNQARPVFDRILVETIRIVDRG